MLVEAAIIWPVIFFSMFFVLTCCLTMYTQAAISASQHQALREAGGKWAETMWYEGEAEAINGSIEDCAATAFVRDINGNSSIYLSSPPQVFFRFLAIYPRLTLSQEKTYRGGVLAPGKRKKTQEVSFDIVDEAQLILNYNYAAELWNKKVKNGDER